VVVDDLHGLRFSQDGGFVAYAVPGFHPTGVSFSCPNPLGCVDFSFDSSGTRLWTADARESDVYELAYPSGVLKRTIAVGGGTRPDLIDAQVIPSL
jgi:hypothetical protein